MYDKEAFEELKHAAEIDLDVQFFKREKFYNENDTAMGYRVEIGIKARISLLYTIGLLTFEEWEKYDNLVNEY